MAYWQVCSALFTIAVRYLVVRGRASQQSQGPESHLEMRAASETAEAQVVQLQVALLTLLQLTTALFGHVAEERPQERGHS